MSPDKYGHSHSLVYDNKNASAIAFLALAFILEQDDLRDRFLAMSGLAGPQLKEMAQDRAFQIGILDFLLSHEPDLLAFIETYSLDPQDPIRAQMALQHSQSSPHTR